MGNTVFDIKEPLGEATSDFSNNERTRCSKIYRIYN